MVDSRAGNAVLRAVALVAVASLGGCNFFGVFGPARPKPYVSQAGTPYGGLRDKTLALVVYAPQATVDEYPGVREEISNFVTKEIRANMPNTRMVDPREIIAWQTSTLNWVGLSETEIAKHFSVDRVLFIEVLDYSTKRPFTYSTLQGHLRALCRVVERDQDSVSPSSGSSPPPPSGTVAAPAWTSVIDVHWPPQPLDPTQTNESAVRLRTLELFASQTVGCFYDRPALP